MLDPKILLKKTPQEIVVGCLGVLKAGDKLHLQAGEWRFNAICEDFSTGRDHDTVGVGTIQAFNVRQDWDIPWFLQAFGGRELDDTPVNKHMSPKKSRSDGFKKGGGDQLQCICHWFLVEIHSKLTAFFCWYVCKLNLGFWRPILGFCLGGWWWVFQSSLLLGGTTTLENPPKKTGQHRIHQTFHFVPTNGGTHLYKFFLWGLC